MTTTLLDTVQEPGILEAPPRVDGLRILDITIFYAPVSGGVRTYLDTKAEFFRNSHLRHSMVVPGPRWDWHAMGRTMVHRVPGIPIPFTPGYRLMRSARILERVLHEERPHVIEVGSPFVVPLLLRRATRGRSVPTLGFYHADLVRTYVEPYVRGLPTGAQEGFRRLARGLVRSVYSRFQVTVAASAAVARELEELGLENVERVPLGVDLEAFHPSHRDPDLRQRLGIPPGRPMALFAGRLCPEKGLDVVVGAHGSMDPGARPHLLFVGEGPSAPGLREVAEGREDVTVLPVISSKKELARVYASSDFYLAAGPGETFGLAVAEAMASGLPLVGVDSGAVVDRVKDSGAGELYGRNDADSCARAMKRMMKAPRADLSRRARAYAEDEMGWSRTFQHLTTLYEELATRGAGR